MASKAKFSIAGVDMSRVSDEAIDKGAASLPDLDDDKKRNALEVRALDWSADLTSPRDRVESHYQRFCRLTGYTEKRIVLLDIADIEQNPYNSRVFYAQRSLNELALNLSAEGQLSPVLVTPATDGRAKFILVDGHRRVRALQKTESKQVYAIVIDRSTPLDLYQTSFSANTQRDTQTVFDDAFSWRRLLEEGVIAEQQELEPLTKYSKSSISKIVQLADLPTYLVEPMANEPEVFGIAMAYEVLLYFKDYEEQPTKKLIDKIVTEKLSSRDVERIRKRKEALSEKAPAKRVRYQHEYAMSLGSGQVVGKLRTYASGKVDMALNDLSVGHQQLLVDGIRELIATLAGAPEV